MKAKGIFMGYNGISSEKLPCELQCYLRWPSKKIPLHFIIKKTQKLNQNIFLRKNNLGYQYFVSNLVSNLNFSNRKYRRHLTLPILLLTFAPNNNT